MQSFLKKFSIVPNKFIDDFFSMTPEEYADKEFNVDFDKIVIWLNVRKDHLKRLLVAKFRENVDYTITTVKVKNNGGNGTHYVEDIKLTPDCFKELCMMSQTKKAKEVRFYYLAIEKLIKKYYNYIQEKLYQKINLLENNQKPKSNKLYYNKGGIIYFFRALSQMTIDEFANKVNKSGLFKIGKTKNAKNRFNTYNSGNANDIDPLFILEVNDIDKVEKCIKNLISDYQYRKYKEIYKTDIDTLKTAFVSCDDLVNGFKKYTSSNNKKNVDKSFKRLRNSENGLFLLLEKNI